MARLGQLLEERADQYAALITSEMGKPFAEARGEVVKAAGGAKHFAEMQGSISATRRSPARRRHPL